MMKNRLPSLAAATLILLPISALGWGPEGHDAVADIAEARLEPETKAAIAEILGSDQISLADIANYPDALRYGPTDGGGLFNPPLAADKETAPWHFINIPISAKVGETPTTATLSHYQDCNEKASGPTAQILGDTVQDCIQEQIKFALSQLETPPPTLPHRSSKQAQAKAAAAWQLKRKVALMYVVHLMGDAHQPMHTSVSNNDQGGNVEHVKFESKLLRLHELWDDLIMAVSWKDQTPGAASALAQKLLKQIDQLPPEEVAGWIADDVETTVNNAIGESFNISQKTIYPEYYQLRHDQAGTKPVAMPADEKARMQPIAFKRLQMAGVRLAYVLNETLGKSSWDGDHRPIASTDKP